jgi:hypothetical protein
MGGGDPVVCACGDQMIKLFEPCRIMIPKRHQAVHDDTGFFDSESERLSYERAADETQRTGTSSEYGYPVVRGDASHLKNLRGLS